MGEPKGARKAAGWGWFEEYRCGCISDVTRVRRDLPGYCPKHGDNRRGMFRDTKIGAMQTERTKTAPRGREENGK